MHWPAPWLASDTRSEAARAAAAHLCRLCGETGLEAVAGFGPLPVAGVYLDPQSSTAGPVAPLTVLRCPWCGLVQLPPSDDPALCASSYYVTSAGRDVRHLGALVKAFQKALPPHARIHSIGSTRLLEDMMARVGFRTSGFAPPADAVIVRHVFDRSEDPAAVFRRIEAVAGPETLLFVEAVDLGETVRNRIYSNFYHSRHCYFDRSTLGRLLDQHGWKPEGALTVAVAGGSLLAWASRKVRPQASRLPFFPLEGAIPAPVCPRELEQFAAGWGSELSGVREFFEAQKAAGLRVAGYGAAERTVAILGMAGLDHSHIAAVYDANPALQGLLLPGTRIPVRPPSAIAMDEPQMVAIFARSYEEDAMATLAGFGRQTVSLRHSPPRLIGGADAPTGRQAA